MSSNAFYKLLRVLEQEAKQQEKLLALLAKERSAIVTLQREDVVRIASEKGEILNQSQQLEQERNAVIGELFPEAKKESISFDDILGITKEPKLKRGLEAARTELKKTVTAVQELNSHNGKLIKQTMGIVASTISIIRSAPQTGLPTYGPSGQIAGKGKNSQDGYTRKA